MTMSIKTALRYAVSALNTLAGVAKADTNVSADDRATIARCEEAAEVLTRVLASAILPQAAAEAGFSAAMTDKLAEFVVEHGLEGVAVGAARYEAGMIAAGINPDEVRERVRVALLSGPDGAEKAQAIFTEINETMKRHKGKKS
jgi:hypothetical protein